MEAVITGANCIPFPLLADGIQLCFDLGLLKSGNDGENDFLPSNPIYRGIFIRSLISNIKMDTPISYKSRWFGENIIDMNGILDAFQDYWHSNSPIIISENSLELAIQQSISDILSQVSSPNSFDFTQDWSPDATRHLIASITRLVNEAFTSWFFWHFCKGP
ncbi:MAG: hypothetical protein LBR80_15765 [Deltaproteobacteria bacterium]|jgi:hypothetical protein|nr:hypothetical protein [Deltaproteobacteria bacterium]